MELRGKLKLPAKICERRDDGWEVSKERDGGLAGGGGGEGSDGGPFKLPALGNDG